ncbi:MAG: Ethanolamine ammonia lyase-activating protein, partial [Deltaproteobacteria bacterium]|nr:Ethanolamine ammonia lyase-activating protein [Deltaproteobacteria bacterium]
EPLKMLAFKPFGQKFSINPDYEKLFLSTTAGGHLIEFEDEDPEVRRIFIDEIKKDGIAFNMPAVTYRR